MTRRPKSPPDLPLLNWGAARLDLIATRRRFWRQVALTGSGCTLVLGSILLPPRPLLIWNASASAPVGLYLVSAPTKIEPGDMVAADLAQPYATFADQRHYLPHGVPLIKRVAAIEHDIVCADADGVWVNGRWLVGRKMTDAVGRPMPSWTGCQYLGEGDVFLLMEEHVDSFDGRYSGVTAPQNIIGKVRLIWQR